MARGAFSRAGVLGFSDSEGHVEPGVSVRPRLKTHKIQTEIHCESLFCLVVEEIMDDKEKQSEESRAVRVGQKQTVTPTLAEWEEHERSHIPCRSWCRHCVAARASNAAHRGRKFTRAVEDDKEMKQVSNDCFVRDHSGMESATILVSKDRGTRKVSAQLVPLTGAVLDWVIQQCARELERLGHYGQITFVEHCQSIRQLQIHSRRGSFSAESG